MTSCLGLYMTENMADMQGQEEYTSALLLRSTARGQQLTLFLLMKRRVND